MYRCMGESITTMSLVLCRYGAFSAARPGRSCPNEGEFCRVPNLMIASSIYLLYPNANSLHSPFPVHPGVITLTTDVKSETN